MCSDNQSFLGCFYCHPVFLFETSCQLLYFFLVALFFCFFFRSSTTRSVWTRCLSSSTLRASPHRGTVDLTLVLQDQQLRLASTSWRKEGERRRSQKDAAKVVESPLLLLVSRWPRPTTVCSFPSNGADGSSLALFDGSTQYGRRIHNGLLLGCSAKEG